MGSGELTVPWPLLPGVGVLNTFVALVRAREFKAVV